MEEAPPPHSAFKIQRLLTFLLKFWWIPLITLVLGLSGGAAYIFWAPPTYVSKARMWETVKLRLPDGALFAEDVQNFLGTQTELLQSTTLRDLAIARMRTSVTNVPVPMGKDGLPIPVIVRVAGSAKSSVFMLEATSSHAAYTQAYLDSLMNVYLDYKRNIRKEVSGGTLASIAEQVQRTERDLKIEQDHLLAFQRTNNMAILQQEGTVAGGYLATLKTKLSDLQLEDRLLQPPPTNAAATGTTNVDASPSFAEASAIAGTSLNGPPSARQSDYKEVELLKIQREKLSKYLRPRHPKIVKLDADIQRGEQLMEIYRRQSREQLTAARQTTQLRIANVQASIQEWERKVVEANSRIAEAERLKLNVQRVQSVYDRLAALLQNVGISRNIDQETLAILEPAIPAKRSYRQEISLLAGSGMGGLGLGLAIVLLIAFRDDRFTSVIEINEKFGDSIVGQVPELPGLNGASTLPLLQIEDERHTYAEAYRGIRSALLCAPAPNERPKVILITSAVPHEGKSTIAANLARTLALGGARVLLVDADLRRGRLHDLLGKQREPGLAELLLHSAELENAIQVDALPNLSFISRGGNVAHPGDLFLGATFDALLATFRERFDYVLIDTSPVFAADDATTLAPKVDGTLFVVRRRFSRAGAVRAALDLLYQRQARVLGLVFNRADASGDTYYYYKHSEYYLPEKRA
jgi:polysaccharide biosynthesis transport protein